MPIKHPVTSPISFTPFNAKKLPTNMLSIFIAWFIGLINSAEMFRNLKAKAKMQIPIKVIDKPINGPLIKDLINFPFTFPSANEFDFIKKPPMF